MAKRQILAVVGATGAQGGGLARAVLNDPGSPFQIRAVTRDTGSDRAKELQRLGAELVQADLDDVESVKQAFQGVYGAYCVTNFWEHFSPEKELQQAANLAEAAKHAALRHVIWSTLEDTRNWVSLSDDRIPTLMGKYKVPHFDAKGEANHRYTDLGVPTTFLLTSFYWENFIQSGLGPQPGADGRLAIALPMGDKKLPGIAVADIGRCAYGIFKYPEKYVGETIGIAAEHLTGEQMATALTAALDREVHYNPVTPEAFRDFGFPGAEDLGNMFQFKRDYNDIFCRIRDIAHSRELNPELLDFEAWLARNKHRIPIAA